jgi:hypothetical protein
MLCAACRLAPHSLRHRFAQLVEKRHKRPNAKGLPRHSMLLGCTINRVAQLGRYIGRKRSSTITR